MRKHQASLLFATVILFAIALSGCGSMRIASTLKPSGETDLSFGKPRFSLIKYTAVYNRNDPAAGAWMDPVTPDFLAQRAKTLYPEIFTDEWTALPVMINADAEYSQKSMMVSAFLTALTAGVIPFPGKMSMDFSMSTDVRNALGESIINSSTGFEIDQAIWISLIGPLGCIPIPGQADLPRDGIFLFIPTSKDAYSTTKLPTYVADCIVESVVRDLRSADPAVLEAACKERASRLQQVSIDGRTCWSFLAPVISGENGRPVAFTAMLYQEYPSRGSTPFEQVVVALSDGSGSWTQKTGYLRRAKSLTAVGVLMNNGVPSRVVVRTVDEPPLEDFIDTPDLKDPERADILRWNNGILLQAKNTSLLKVLKEKSRDELLALVTRIEMSILDLSEQAERAKDRAQTMVQKGEGDPAPERELSILCNQRIEVLKPILAALKQEAAFRQP